MELELKKLEDLSEAIVNDFAYMRAREEQMRDTNGERMNYFHLFDLCPVLILITKIHQFCHET